MNQSTLSPMKEPPHSPIPDQIKTPKCSFVKTEQKMFWWLLKKAFGVNSISHLEELNM